LSNDQHHDRKDRKFQSPSVILNLQPSVSNVLQVINDFDTLQQAPPTVRAMSLFAYILWWAWIAILTCIAFVIIVPLLGVVLLFAIPALILFAIIA